MQDVQNWLSGDRDFKEGVRLYHKYGTNAFFKNTLLPAGATPYNVSKLVNDLQKLVTTAPQPAPQKDIAPPQTATQQAQNHLKYVQLCQQRDLVVKQLDRNMAALHFSNNQTVLFETAKQILRLQQKKTELWAQIDYYNENQSFEPEKPVKQVSREKQMQLIYQSICKARKRLADPNYTQKAKTQKLIDKKLKELEEIKCSAMK